MVKVRVKGYDGSFLVMLVQKVVKVLSDPAPQNDK